MAVIKHLVVACLIQHLFCNIIGSDVDGSIGAPKRILYNVGHMANDIPQTDQFLADGANALEVDIRFERNGVPTRLYHGVPCDCFRTCHRYEEIGTFLQHVSRRSTPGSIGYTERLAVVFLDLKLTDVDQHEAPLYAAGDGIARKLIEYMYQNGTSNTMLWIIIGIPNVSHSSALKGFRDLFNRQNQSRILDKVGYEVTDEDNMDVVQQMFRSLNLVHGIWQGDGITNCVAGRNDARLRQAIVKRDAPSGPWVNVQKVYRWTIDTKTAIRHSLRLGVDGIMTNDPDDVAEVVAEPEFAYRYRLATNADNPLVKIKGPGPLRFGCTRNWCWKDCTFTVYSNNSGFSSVVVSINVWSCRAGCFSPSLFLALYHCSKNWMLNIMQNVHRHWISGGVFTGTGHLHCKWYMDGCYRSLSRIDEKQSVPRYICRYFVHFVRVFKHSQLKIHHGFS